MIVGTTFKNNLNILFQQRFNKFLYILKSSGLFGSSIKNYNEIYLNYLNNDICEFFVHDDENLYLPGFLQFNLLL